MIGRKELRQTFENKPWVTKKYVMERMGFSQVASVRKYFAGLGCSGRRYLTEDVITKILEYVEYPD